MHDALFQFAGVHRGHGARLRARTVSWMRASGDSDSSGVNSQLVPLNASTSSFWMRWRRSVLYLSRGTKTRARDEAVEAVAPHEQPGALMLLQPQDADARYRTAHLSSAWNRSSRGYCSRMVTSDLYRWPLVRKPARARMLAHLRRASGISLVADHIGGGRVQPHEAPLAEQPCRWRPAASRPHSPDSPADARSRASWPWSGRSARRLR